MPDPIDPSVFARFEALGKPGLAGRLITLFLDSAPKTLLELHTAYAERDLPSVSRAAHALRSSAGNFGAAPLVDLAGQLERLARNGDDDLVDLVTSVDAEFARVRLRLETAQAELWMVRKRIAIVEDSPDNRLLLQAILEDRFDVVEFDNGEAALAGLEAARPDLVLMDISLPVMDGTEVLARMRASASLRSIPVIALTAHAMRGDREKFLAVGFDGYVTKPVVDEDNLFKPIDRLLGRGARPEQPS